MKVKTRQAAKAIPAKEVGTRQYSFEEIISRVILSLGDIDRSFGAFVTSGASKDSSKVIIHFKVLQLAIEEGLAFKNDLVRELSVKTEQLLNAANVYIAHPSDENKSKFDELLELVLDDAYELE